MTRRWSLLFALVTLGIACGEKDLISPQQMFGALSDAGARSCGPTDTCTWVEQRDCICGRPLNANFVDYYYDLAKRVDCSDYQPQCLLRTYNIRCEDGTCTGDTQP